MCVRICVGLYVLACSCMSRYVYVHTSTCLHMACTSRYLCSLFCTQVLLGRVCFMHVSM